MSTKKTTYHVNRHVSEDGTHYQPGDEISLAPARAKAMAHCLEELAGQPPAEEEPEGGEEAPADAKPDKPSRKGK